MTSLTHPQLVCLVLGLAVATVTALYQRQRNRELTGQLTAVIRSIQKAPLRHFGWKTQAPHCGGLWCILHLPVGAKLPLIATVEVKDNVTAEGVRTMLHGAEILLTLGPLPRLSEQLEASQLSNPEKA